MRVNAQAIGSVTSHSRPNPYNPQTFHTKQIHHSAMASSSGMPKYCGAIVFVCGDKQLLGGRPFRFLRRDDCNDAGKKMLATMSSSVTKRDGGLKIKTPMFPDGVECAVFALVQAEVGEFRIRCIAAMLNDMYKQAQNRGGYEAMTCAFPFIVKYYLEYKVKPEEKGEYLGQRSGPDINLRDPEPAELCRPIATSEEAFSKEALQQDLFLIERQPSMGTSFSEEVKVRTTDDIGHEDETSQQEGNAPTAETGKPPTGVMDASDITIPGTKLRLQDKDFLATLNLAIQGMKESVKALEKEHTTRDWAGLVKSVRGDIERMGDVILQDMMAELKDTAGKLSEEIHSAVAPLRQELNKLSEAMLVHTPKVARNLDAESPLSGRVSSVFDFTSTPKKPGPSEALPDLDVSPVPAPSRRKQAIENIVRCMSTS